MSVETLNTVADILKYQNDCARTQNLEPLGRMQKIAIGPNSLWNPRTPDAVMQRIGRFIELRDQPLPIAQSRDRSMLIVPALLQHKVTGRVELPDVPDPNWVPGAPTVEEIEGIEVEREIKDAQGKVLGKRKVRAFPNDKDWPGGAVQSNRVAPMLKQDLAARAEGILEGTNFLVFSPVLSITFQPEINRRMVGDAWVIECKPDHSVSPATQMTLLVDRQTGEIHFYGGTFEILGNSPK